jgi:hypothetical protein
MANSRLCHTFFVATPLFRVCDDTCRHSMACSIACRRWPIQGLSHFNSQVGYHILHWATMAITSLARPTPVENRGLMTPPHAISSYRQDLDGSREYH